MNNYIKPLDGVKILDLTRVLAGPICTQQLADLGADVVKVEKPQAGDDTRHWGPPFVDEDRGLSAYFICANRGKRSIAVDIHSSAGQKLIHQLVAKADVFIENFKSDSLKDLSLDFLSIKKINPNIIYCSISGYGSEGQRAQTPGYDALIQAECGLMSLTGFSADSAINGYDLNAKVGVAVVDLFTGMYASQAILAALLKRFREPKAQKIDISLYDTQLSLLANQASSYLVSHKIPTLMGTAHPNIVPYQMFQTQQNPIMIAVGNDTQFARLCEILNIADLAYDPKAKTNKQRVLHREWVIKTIQNACLTFKQTDLLEQLQQAQVPVAPLQNLQQLFDSSFLKQRNMLASFDKEGMQLPYMNSPILFDGVSNTSTRPPPFLDEDKESILEDWLN